MDTVINENPRDMIKILKRGEEDKYKRDADAQQQQLQAQQQELQANQVMHQEEIAERQKDRDIQQYISDSANQTKIQVAEINVYSRQENLDADMNGIPDPIEIAAQSLKEREVASKSFLEHAKLTHDKNKHQSDINLKQKEINSKIEIENRKLQMVREQNANQEKLAAQKAKLDKEMMQEKIKLERMKIKAKPKTPKK